ncbi:MAG: sigma-54 dependent transcriptional regulator [Desulfobacterales bacterium]|jgi:transcriptional regulator with GAF, ATPase, and Fis domain|nr:sigma-54 dependent transcriptional regulator [Desulfobacterales bacterium]
MAKKKKQFQISLYILVPFISSGIALLWVLLTDRVLLHIQTSKSSVWTFFSWEVAVSVITFLLSLLITWVMLEPVSRFIRKAESMPAYPRPPEDCEEPQPADSIAHYSKVFERIASILSKVEARELFPGMVGQSAIMRGIFTQILKVARTDSTVLISGESGTGKELVASSLYEHSLRRDKPFIKLNCVAIPEGLLESELFGHEKGAFTGATAQKIGKFELADGGTIFLDEIGDMPLATQAKLLRVLQEKEFERVGGNQTIQVDVRFIAATNKNLMDMVKQGTFREDLYYRLNVFSIHLPPLRDRKEDIPLLVSHFLEQSANPVKLSAEGMQVLMANSLPGNIRELQNILERAAVMTDSGTIEPRHLALHNDGAVPARILQNAESTQAGSIDERLHEVEKGLIIEALSRSGGVQVKAAGILGINQRSLWHRIKKLGIDVDSLKHQQKM